MTEPAGHQPEEARIRAEYARRAADPHLARLYSPFQPAALLHQQSIDRNLLALLKKHDLTELSAQRILEVGCGSGGQLRRFLEYGASPANLFGLDLLPDRIATARQLSPAINWQAGGADHLPYQDHYFDLVTVFVMFSSILEPALQRGIALEMRRVLKPGGRIVWYDFAFSNPRNPAVLGVPQPVVIKLFQAAGVRFDLRRITLAPPLARRVAPRSMPVSYTHLTLPTT